MAAKPRVIEIALRKVDALNWHQVMALKLKPGQEDYVWPPEKSLAKAYIKPYGEHMTIVPHAIYEGNLLLGYMTWVADPASEENYWIDDIMIDARMQGQGYGRAATIETIRTMLRAYPRCRAINLTCHPANTLASRLYLDLGFEATGEIHPSGSPIYTIRGRRLDEYRSR